MTTAGYSGTSLVKKLGIKSGQKVLILNQPDTYAKTLGKLPAGVTLVKRFGKELDFIQFFTKELGELTANFPRLKAALAQDGTLWVSWPKKAAKVQTDLDENIVREVGLRNGLVDVKVTAVDETWSGLKFVYRLKDRQ